MAFPNKAQQNDIRQSLPPITGIYPTMNMMLTGKKTNNSTNMLKWLDSNNSWKKTIHFLGYPTAGRPHTVGPRPSHVNPNFNKNNRTPR